MYKEDLVLNNQGGIICHEYKPTNQPNISLRVFSSLELSLIVAATLFVFLF